MAETQQALLDSGLRTRVILQTDGQMRTGRDVVIGALLGADEIGLSTAPLIATGCIMMRVCHLNTCPVGVATQDPELRARFSGKPEHVVNYMIMVAEEARGLMAALGIKRFGDLVGRTELLSQNDAIDHWKASSIDLTPLLAVPPKAVNAPRGFVSGDAKQAAGRRSRSTSASCSARRGPRSRTAPRSASRPPSPTSTSPSGAASPTRSWSPAAPTASRTTRSSSR